jgi:hypothetical protein
LIGRSGSESELEEFAMEDQNLFVPLQFFFCRHLMCSLPLIALQYHQVELKVTFKKLNDVVAFPGYKLNKLEFDATNSELASPDEQALGANATFYQLVGHKHLVTLRPRDGMERNYPIKGAQLMCNLVYLEEEERKTFAGSTHEYLVDLLQFQGPQSTGELNTTYHAYFNHPTSEIIWTFVPNVSIANGEPFNYTALQSAYNAAGDTLKQAKLQFNGYDRFGYFPAEYFREIIPAQVHTSVPTRPVYVYSFALEPEDFRPSGSVNLSRIDNVKLVLDHVRFNPEIQVSPVVATDKVNDIFKHSTMSLAQAGAPGAPNPAGLVRGLVKNSQTDFASGLQSTGITRNMVARDLAKMQNSTAVAVHPDKVGKGLFLQQTDGMATEIIPGAVLHVYARSKNVLRIKSGMAGLAYAN